MKFVLSCEHGGNQVPAQYDFLFKNKEDVLNSHRGWDPGALDLFHAMHINKVSYSIYSETTRLLVDLNRSLYRRTLFSEFSGSLNATAREQVLKEYYFPFRKDFEDALDSLTANGEEVFHVSVHSFTPVLNGDERNAEIGILYNPEHNREKEIARLWKHILLKKLPEFRIRFNYPYLGKTDGHVAALRKRYGKFYAGIEFELCNKFRNDLVVYQEIVESYQVLCNALG
jgi:predicted N-formylglutamate amidohydrolase